MYEIIVTFPYYKVIFELELIIAAAITTANLKRRKHFGLRVTGAFLFLITAACVFPVIWYNSIYISFLYLSLYLLTVWVLRFCFREPGINLFFCAAVAYTAQHMAYETFNFLNTITGCGRFGDMYRQDTGMSDINVLSLFLYAASYALVYWVIWVLSSCTIYMEEKLEVGGYLSRMALSFIIVLSNVVLNAVFVFGAGTEEMLPKVVYVVNYLQSVLCCCLAMGIQFTMLSREAAELETERIKTLWKCDKDIYEQFQESAELINIKCHDLKHQLRALRTGQGAVDKNVLEEIEKEIAIYNCNIETGNQVLDTILAEKSLQCEYEQIRFTCIAAGQELNFLSAESICSLFGNAITNAIEAVKKVEDKEKRKIHLDITRHREMIFIHMENYCIDADKLIFSDGLPETTKEDRSNHGYGMRSMQLLAEKLGGGLEVHLCGDMFHLNVFIPAKV